MTEQPPSAEANKIVETLGPARWGIQERSVRRELAIAFDRFAERVCEQRVSAETEARLARLGEPDVIDAVAAAIYRTQGGASWVRACSYFPEYVEKIRARAGDICARITEMLT